MTRVHDPKPGLRYSLAVHGEPPEGVEVLWSDMPEELTSWTETRYKHVDTHWMRAPVDAPVPDGRPVMAFVNDEPIQGHPHYKEYVDAPSADRMEEVRRLGYPVPEQPPFPGVRSDYGDIREGR